MLLLESKYQWIDTLFDWCVQTIKDFGLAFGMNDNEANILIFCIVWPLLFLYFMVLALLNTRYKSKTLKKITWISVITILLSPFFLWIMESFFHFLLQHEQFAYFVDHASTNSEIINGTINIFSVFFLFPCAVLVLIIYALIMTGIKLHKQFTNNEDMED